MRLTLVLSLFAGGALSEPLGKSATSALNAADEANGGSTEVGVPSAMDVDMMNGGASELERANVRALTAANVGSGEAGSGQMYSTSPPAAPPPASPPPTSPPPSPQVPPLPPLAPGGAVVLTVTSTFTVAGTVSSFNEPAFTAALARAVSVNESQISLAVTAASVSVVATIATTSNNATEANGISAAVDDLAANVTAASATLGVSVEAVTAPVTAVATVAPPPPSPSSPPSPLTPVAVAVVSSSDEIVSGLPNWAFYLICGGGGAALLAAVAFAVFRFLKKPAGAKRGLHAPSSASGYTGQGREYTAADDRPPDPGPSVSAAHDEIELTVNEPPSAGLPQPAVPPPAEEQASAAGGACAAAAATTTTTHAGVSGESAVLAAAAATPGHSHEAAKLPPPRPGAATGSGAPAPPAAAAGSGAEAVEAGKLGAQQIAELKMSHKAIKARLREYEVAFKEQHGRPPHKQRDWGPVWELFQEYQGLRQRIALAEQPLMSKAV